MPTSGTVDRSLYPIGQIPVAYPYGSATNGGILPAMGTTGVGGVGIGAGIGVGVIGGVSGGTAGVAVCTDLDANCASYVNLCASAKVLDVCVRTCTQCGALATSIVG